MSQKALNEDEMRRLKELNAKIDSLREQLKSAELEKSKLMNKLYKTEHEVIDSLPGYIQNGLRKLGITTDSELNRYINGEFTTEDFKGTGDMYFAYVYLNRANTRKKRLMLFRGVGEKTAEDAIKIIKEKGM